MMSYKRPFQAMSADIASVRYRVVYTDTSEASSILGKLKDKRSTLQNDVYIKTLGRRMRTRDETLVDNVLEFTAMVDPAHPDLSSMESELVGVSGTIESKQ